MTFDLANKTKRLAMQTKSRVVAGTAFKGHSRSSEVTRFGPANHQLSGGQIYQFCSNGRERASRRLTRTQFWPMWRHLSPWVSRVQSILKHVTSLVRYHTKFRRCRSICICRRNGSRPKKDPWDPAFKSHSRSSEMTQCDRVYDSSY